MIKKIAWDAFKKTGDINTFLEFKQIENMENNMQQLKEIYELEKGKETKSNSNRNL